MFREFYTKWARFYRNNEHSNFTLRYKMRRDGAGSGDVTGGGDVTGCGDVTGVVTCS